MFFNNGTSLTLLILKPNTGPQFFRTRVASVSVLYERSPDGISHVCDINSRLYLSSSVLSNVNLTPTLSFMNKKSLSF